VVLCFRFQRTRTDSSLNLQYYENQDQQFFNNSNNPTTLSLSLDCKVANLATQIGVLHCGTTQILESEVKLNLLRWGGGEGRTFGTWTMHLASTARVDQLVSEHLGQGLLIVFARGPHCLWCPKSRWSPSLGPCIALKIGQNRLEVRKLWPPKVEEGVIFTENSPLFS
jgi:hypothetical protein